MKRLYTLGIVFNAFNDAKCERRSPKTLIKWKKRATTTTRIEVDKNKKKFFGIEQNKIKIKQTYVQFIENKAWDFHFVFVLDFNSAHTESSFSLHS